MKPSHLLRSGVGLAVAACALFATRPAMAQAARVTAVQATVEKRAGDSAWTKAPVGTDLRTGDRIRTGKRSKVDMKFGDGSLIRLGQLSLLEMRNDKEVQLSSGRLLFSYLKPGRILAGAGAAEVKGTVGIVALDDIGNVTFSLYAGLVDVVTPIRTVQLEAGRFVTLRPNGSILRQGEAAPLEYADGTRNPELLAAPSRAPYVGSPRQTRSRESTHRQSLDPIIDTVRAVQTQDRVHDTDPDDSNVPDPFPNPFPTPVANPVPTPFPTLPPPDDTGGEGTFPSTEGITALEVTRQLSQPQAPAKSIISHSEAAIGTDPILLAQAATDIRESNPEATGNIPNNAEDHIGDADLDEGSTYGSDARILGAFADEGAYAFGGRLHGYAAKGRWFVDGAVTPLRISRKTVTGRQYDNQVNVTDLSATYRADSFEVQAGRMRYLAGPSQVSLFGSMIRQGGREIMDGIRIRPNLGDKTKLELSYLHDAFINDLPYRVSGRQKGFYGRLQQETSFGNFGLNLLKYTDSAVEDTVGATVDFSVPLIRNQLEFYGEAGRDPFRRRLTNLGVYFPGLYQKTGFDVYLEWAQLKNSSASAGAPDEVALRVYKRINKYADAMLTASRFEDGDKSLILGVSIGDPVNEE